MFTARPNAWSASSRGRSVKVRPCSGFRRDLSATMPHALSQKVISPRCSFSIRCAVRTWLSDRHGRKSTTSLRKRGSRVSAHSCPQRQQPACAAGLDDEVRLAGAAGHGERASRRPLVRIDSLMSSNFAFVARRGLCS